MWETADLSTVITSLPKLNHQQENWFIPYAGRERAHCTFPDEQTKEESLECWTRLNTTRQGDGLDLRGWNEVVSHFKDVSAAN